MGDLTGGWRAGVGPALPLRKSMASRGLVVVTHLAGFHRSGDASVGILLTCVAAFATSAAAGRLSAARRG